MNMPLGPWLRLLMTWIVVATSYGAYYMGQRGDIWLWLIITVIGSSLVGMFSTGYRKASSSKPTSPAS